MADSNGFYFDYQLMNETFTSIGKKDICDMLIQRPSDNAFLVKDSRGKEVPFLRLSTMTSDGHLYAYLLPLIPVQGLKEGDTVVFEADKNTNPPSMHAVKNKKLAAELKDVFSREFEKHIDRTSSLKSRLEDPDNHDTINLSFDNDREVHFRKLASMYIGEDLYVIFEPLDCFDVFKKNEKIVYRYDEKMSPQSFEVPDYKYQSIIRGKYRKESQLKWKREGNRHLASAELVYDDFFEKSTFVPSNGKNIYELLLVSSVEKSKPLVLIDDAGRKISFSIEAVTSYGYTLYALLNPVTKIKGCDDDTEILFCVNDTDFFSPVLTVETRSDVYDKIVDGIYEIFERDDKVFLDYPRAEEIVKHSLYDRPVFFKQKGGDMCRFMLEYIANDRPGKIYAVLRALSTGRGFMEDAVYAFSVGKEPHGVLDVEFDKDIVIDIVGEYEMQRVSGKGRKNSTVVMNFTCPKCHTHYSGDVCPKCGTVRINLDSADFPACTYLNSYAESYCHGYMEWEEKKYSFIRHENFMRCGDASEEDVPCVMDFKSIEDGFVVTGIGGCRASNVGVPSEFEGKPVVGIEKSAFAKCPIRFAHVPGSVKSVGAGAFEGSPNLGRVEFDSLARIEENTFADCPAYFWCEFPDDLESIGRHAFLNCKQISSVVIPVSMVSIDEGAFEGCSGIVVVYYKGTEEEWSKIRIEKKGNENLLGAELLFYSKEKPTKPGKFWHYQSNSYSSYRTKWRAYKEPALDYSAYVSNAYLPTYGLDYMVTHGGYAVLGRGDCEEKNIVIPPTYRGEKVVAVSSGAFEDDKTLENIVISKGVDIIGDGAFYGCYRLKNVTILSDVSVIEERTFARCTSLAGIVIPDTCVKIAKNAFSACDYVSIFYKGNASRWRRIDTALEGNACLFDDSRFFSYSEERPSPVKGRWHYSEKFKPTKWTGVQKGPTASGKQSDGGMIKYPFDPVVNLPQEDVLLGDAEDENLAHGLEYQRFGKCCVVAGLGGCTNKNLVLPCRYNGLTVAAVGPSAFKDRTDITSVTIPAGVSFIDEEAFSGCANLSDVSLPSTLLYIGDYAFTSSGLTDFKIPDDVVRFNLGVSAFEGCKTLRSFAFGECLITIPTNIFSGCTALEYVVLPRYFWEIKSGAFKSCRNLKSVFFPSTERDWKKELSDAHVTKEGNVSFLSATVYFYSEERPEMPGNFWHYDDERNPVIWD
ncbi:MAG: leucine-rich repeat domain-containing protein [Clostridia bacterium]|nr:leucine-rich repeat domain-containing protein [Clostridia bacterium]